MAQIVQAQALADFVDDGSLATSLATWANAILTAAQAAVEQYLTGREGSLTSGASQTETVFLRIASPLVPLRYGPATTLASATVSTVDQTARFELRPYSLRVLPIYPQDQLAEVGVLPQQPVTVVYTQGWSDVTKVPVQIQKGILLTAAVLLNRQDVSISSEKLDQATNAYRSGDIVPVAARTLMAQYRDPGMVGL